MAFDANPDQSSRFNVLASRKPRAEFGDRGIKSARLAALSKRSVALVASTSGHPHIKVDPQTMIRIVAIGGRGSLIEVVAPFVNVPQHVKTTQVVGKQLGNGLSV